MKVLVTGSRYWQDTWILWMLLTGIKTVYPDMELIVGDCKTGADVDAWGWAKANLKKGKARRYKALWDKYGKRAGFLRDAKMVEKELPDVVLGFSRDIANSKGTKLTMNHAVDKVTEDGREIEVYLVAGRVHARIP